MSISISRPLLQIVWDMPVTYRNYLKWFLDPCNQVFLRAARSNIYVSLYHFYVVGYTTW